MPEISKLSLNSGELSDEIAGRIDLSKFNSGCEILENAKVLRAGGVSRRAGFEYVDTVIDNDEKSRLEGFRFSGDQGVIIEFSHLKMRVIYAGDVFVETYTTPWTRDQIFDLQFAQKIDRIVVTHPDVPVHDIIRTDTTTTNAASSVNGYLKLEGATNSFASIPDPLGSLGDFAMQWDGLSPEIIRPAASIALTAQYGSATDRAWFATMNTSGQMYFYFFAAGDVATQLEVSCAAVPTDTVGIRLTREGTGYKFFTDSGGGYTQHATGSMSGAAIFDCTDDLDIGKYATNSSPVTGRISRVQIWTNGTASGNPVVDADFRDVSHNLTPGDTLAATAGGTITLNGGATTVNLDGLSYDYLQLRAATEDYVSISTPNVSLTDFTIEFNGLDDTMVHYTGGDGILLSQPGAFGLYVHPMPLNQGGHTAVSLFYNYVGGSQQIINLNGLGNIPLGTVGLRFTRYSAVPPGLPHLPPTHYWQIHTDDGSGFVLNAGSNVPDGLSTMPNSASDVLIARISSNFPPNRAGQIGRARIWDNGTQAGTPVLDVDFSTANARAGLAETGQNITYHNGAAIPGPWEIIPHPWIERIWETYDSPTTYALSCNATTGTSKTITSDGDLFGPTWVGDRIRLDHAVSEVRNEYRSDAVLAGRALFQYNSGVYAFGAVVYEDVGGKLIHYTTKLAYNHGSVTPAGTSPSDYPAYFEAGVVLVPETTIEKGWVFETFNTWDGAIWVQRSYDGGTTWQTIKTITSDNDRNERVAETETQTTLIRVLISEFATGSSNSLRTEFTVNSYSENGSALITAYVSPAQVTVDIEKNFHSTDAAVQWFEAAFSPRNGYPTAVSYYQSRLCFGGTKNRPQTLWLSRTQSPFDFTIGTLATDGMSFQTDAEGYESITWLSSHISLLVGTTLGVWSIYSQSGAPLTPESNGINRQMKLGAASGFQAMPLQSNVLFLQDKGRKIQELTGGSSDYSGYLASDLTQLATHITRDGVTQMTVGNSPDSSLYLITGAEIALLTYERSQNVVGWGRWKTAGSFESVATTTGAGEEDDVYVSVLRGSVRSIERLAPDMPRVEEDNDMPNLRFLDSYAKKVSSSSFTTVTDLSRFDGQSVNVYLDGVHEANVTVANGVATLPQAGFNAVIGLPYTTEVRPMSIDFGTIGSKSAINEIVLRFRNTLGGEVSQDRLSWSKVSTEQPRNPTTDPPSLQSRDYQATPHSTWGRQPSISVRQTAPLPMTILAMRIQTKSSK